VSSHRSFSLASSFTKVVCSQRARVLELCATAVLCGIFLPHNAMAAQAATPPSASRSANFDGPAELPRVYVKSTIADTPAPGKVWQVKESENLQNTLNQASCGDTLKLQEGANFTGQFHLPAKACDDAHWIVIRTSTRDENLPLEGTRIRPCFAGVASLPGRPDFRCPTVKNVMARLTFAGKSGNGPLVFASGANHYRLIGIEITRDSPGAQISNLAGPEKGGTADHIIFDRVWIHGTAQDETTRGVFLSGTRFMAVVDSYFSDFHCVAMTGACTDAQAISGGAGDNPMGPFKIVNNFLEASGENIIFGGAAATATPADIEIRHNHLFKPMIWMQGQPGFVGGASGHPFIVKNIFELKNAQRVLFEGNLLENVWGGFSQAGFAIALTPKNQAPNLCPLCRVTDITLRYNRVTHTGGGMQIANVLSDTKGTSAAGERYSIHDMIFDDLDGTTYKGFGMFALVSSVAPKLHDVWLDHLTALTPRVMFGINGRTGEPKIANFVFRNSIVAAGERQLAGTGGGPISCASHQRNPSDILDNCFDNPTFTHNAIVGARGNWPPHNFFPGNFTDVGFVNFNNGNGGNYTLCRVAKDPASCKSVSKYARAGTDGKDLGADVDAVDAATAGVE